MFYALLVGHHMTQWVPKITASIKVLQLYHVSSKHRQNIEIIKKRYFMSMFNHMVLTQDSRKILSLKVFLVSNWSRAGHFSENKGKIIMKCNFQIFRVKIVIKAHIECDWICPTSWAKKCPHQVRKIIVTVVAIHPMSLFLFFNRMYAYLCYTHLSVSINLSM